MAKTGSSSDIPVVGFLINKIIGSRNDRFVKKYTQRVEAINALEPQMRALSDAQLRGKLKELRDRHASGAKHEELMIVSFAVARVGMERLVGIRNIFNPEAGFDPSKLPAEARSLYEQTKAKMDAAPTLLPRTLLMDRNAPPPQGVADESDSVMGSVVAIPGWMYVDIPNGIYEAVRELYPLSRPPFRARPFDVQLIGAMVLSGGKIAEMKTGEGKTIVAPLACYLAAVEGLSIHVVTVNDYLVQRDRDWTFPFFRGLGLTVGAIHPQHMQPEQIKRLMYRCDVVYGTTSEFGFDYLRDNMKRRFEDQVQRRRQFAIVDEVDSTLIDEARTPLIISGQAHEDAPRYEVADRLARHLVEKQKPWQEADQKLQACIHRIKGIEGDIRNARDKGNVPQLKAALDEAKAELPKLTAERDLHVQFYDVQLDRRQCYLTHDGVAEAQRAANIGSFYVGENMDLPHLLENALRARVVYQRDRDYIVAPMENPQTGRPEPSVIIVDVNTGRPMVGRQWSDGLHQAVESKEGVPIKQETQTVATITIQNMFKMYKRLAGMTGTADTEAQEFHDIYKLDVVAIPTNKAVARYDFNDLMYLREKDKWEAIVDEIKRFHDLGRPILVGTTSVEKSERLSEMLTRRHGIKHEVLNAKQHEREAHMVAEAGRLGAVMIATNMAGRGTDIKLGSFTREELADHWLRRGIASKGLDASMTDEQLRENIYRKIAAKELELQKREAEEMPFEQLELELLRRWALEFTMASEKGIGSASAEQLRAMLDETGRTAMHRLRWFENVEDLGGLHVIGTERHESRRIDNQLRGRSGRQGDKGSSRFFVAFEDELMKLFGGEALQRFLGRFGGMKEGDAIEHPWLSKSVERAQRKVEERNFQIRKNLLEYDEVMEHQRQTFYGMRQRVLMGRNVRGLVFDFVETAVRGAVGEYLAPGYRAECAAEHARQVLDIPIAPERLRGKEIDEMEKVIRADALSEVRANIAVTLGEYIPNAASEVSMDLDAEGLARWAKSSFGVELSREQLVSADLDGSGTLDRREIEAMLSAAAEDRIGAADLSGLERFAAMDYGAQELCRWVDKKFAIRVEAKEILERIEAESEDAAVELIMDKVRELAEKREVEYPVDFVMQMTMAMMSQSPDQAFGYLHAIATRRYGLKMTAEELRTKPPQQVREILLNASKAFVTEGRLEAAIEEAAGIEDNDKLEAHFREKYNANLPDDVRHEHGEDRILLVRGYVESILRAELVQFERAVLIDLFDDSWKSHLYAMDQLRGAIGFRAISQQDPRIEYKREGSRLFRQALDGIRDKVTDVCFRGRLVPGGQGPMGGTGGPGGFGGFGGGGGGGGGSGMPPMPQPQPARAMPAAVPAGAVSGLAGPGMAGPGMDSGGDLYYTQPPRKPAANPVNAAPASSPGQQTTAHQPPPPSPTAGHTGGQAAGQGSSSSRSDGEPTRDSAGKKSSTPPTIRGKKRK